MQSLLRHICHFHLSTQEYKNLNLPFYCSFQFVARWSFDYFPCWRAALGYLHKRGLDQFGGSGNPSRTCWGTLSKWPVVIDGLIFTLYLGKKTKFFNDYSAVLQYPLSLNTDSFSSSAPDETPHTFFLSFLHVMSSCLISLGSLQSKSWSKNSWIRIGYRIGTLCRMPSVPFDSFLLTQKICIPLVSYNFFIIPYFLRKWILFSS